MSPGTKRALLAEQQLRKETQANTLSNGQYSVTLVFESAGQLSFDQLSAIASEQDHDVFGERHPRLMVSNDVDQLYYDDEATIRDLKVKKLRPFGTKRSRLKKPQVFAFPDDACDRTILVHPSVESQRRGSSVVVPAQQLLATNSRTRRRSF
jgi:hypothetical protein